MDDNDLGFIDAGFDAVSGLVTDVLDAVGILDTDGGIGVDDLTVVAGDVDAHDDHWHHQGATNGCAVAAQGSIIEALTGRDFDLNASLAYLTEQGFYDPGPNGGTRPEDLTRLLEAHGVPHQVGFAEVADVHAALQRGDMVMAVVDANEIWYPQDDPTTGEPMELRNGGHVVWVTGMGVDPDTGEWHVVLNDSGPSDGRNSVVALEDFVNATDDYGGHSVFVSGPSGGHVSQEVRA